MEDSSNKLNNDNGEPPREKAVNKNVFLKIVLGFFQVITGLIASSMAFVADGVNTFVSIPSSIRASEKNKDTKSITRYAFIIIFAVISAWIIIYTFFEMSRVINYLDTIADIWIVPCIIIALLTKITMLVFTREQLKEKSEQLRAEKREEISRMKFDIFVSVIVLLSVVFSYVVDFYFESVVAMALGVYIFASAIEETKKMAHIKKVKEIEEIIAETEQGDVKTAE